MSVPVARNEGNEQTLSLELNDRKACKNAVGSGGERQETRNIESASSKL